MGVLTDRPSITWMFPSSSISRLLPAWLFQCPTDAIKLPTITVDIQAVHAQLLSPITLCTAEFIRLVPRLDLHFPRRFPLRVQKSHYRPASSDKHQKRDLQLCRLCGTIHSGISGQTDHLQKQQLYAIIPSDRKKPVLEPLQLDRISEQWRGLSQVPQY
eukprot:g28552.t1